MCGILGHVADHPAVSDEPVRRALAALNHRGPDARSVRTLRGQAASCVLAHTRLRIIDLSPLADQPLANEDGTVWVAYNGEIYNFRELRAELEGAGHRMRSDSDTDVLVHLYEEAGGDSRSMLSRLRGMFSFALFDVPRGRLLLARDRLGIKPMYWTALPGGLAFSSEVRPLARAGFVSGEPDLQSVAAYLRWGVVPGPSSVLAGVNELPPGSFLVWEASGTSIDRWWRPDVEPDPLLAQDPERLVRGALIDSVSRHLIADRPLGAFLSGGVDSAAVVSCAARLGAVRALTVTFPDVSDEGDAASAIAARVGATHERVPVTGAELADSLPTILRAMDQPTLDGVNTWIVCRATREAGLVVALSGIGGDELFGGYPSTRLVPRLATLNKIFAPLPHQFRKRLVGAASHRAPGGRLARVLAADPGYAGSYEAVRTLFAREEWQLGDAEQRCLGEVPKGLHPHDSVMLLELNNYLPNQLLRDTDAMSMSHSLEIRVPLLDDTLVRVALSMPAETRTKEGKALLAKAAGLETWHPKQPFALPFTHWMRGPLRAPVREALLSDELPFRDLIPAAFRRRLWDSFELGRTHWSRPWSVAVLRLWPAANGFSWS